MLIATVGNMWAAQPGTRASAATEALQPTDDEFVALQEAFKAIASDPARPGAKEEVEKAEVTFGNAIERWEGPLRASPQECTQLRLARARARVTLNDIAFGKRPLKAAAAVEDLDVVISTMEQDEAAVRISYDYPDALVRRALAKEEIKEWAGAVADYSKAINLWRERPPSENGLGVNPLVLNFRGNALSRLSRFDDALKDYMEATQIFVQDRRIREASLSRCNEALALFGAGQADQAIATLQLVVRKDPAVTDARVALAAAYWATGDVSRAESEWLYACEKIETGCRQYKDLEWVSEIRRWPPSLVEDLRDFLKKETQ